MSIGCLRSLAATAIALLAMASPCWLAATGNAAGAGAAEEAATPFSPPPLSRGQIAQLIADQGYFEVADLRRMADGSWRCTASAEPGKRVTLSIDAAGHIFEGSKTAGGQQ